MRTGEELGKDWSRSEVLQISSQISSPSDSDGLENNLKFEEPRFQDSRRIIYNAHGHLSIRPPFASFTFCAREGSSRLWGPSPVPARGGYLLGHPVTGGYLHSL